LDETDPSTGRVPSGCTRQVDIQTSSFPLSESLDFNWANATQTKAPLARASDRASSRVAVTELIFFTLHHACDTGGRDGQERDDGENDEDEFGQGKS